MTTLYLDHAAATPPRSEVIEAMREAREESWANPSSTHDAGRQARRTLSSARESVAALLGYRAHEIHFVRGGTEANNLALRGIAGAPGNRRPLVLSTLEHSSVREPAEALAREGLPVQRLLVLPSGSVDDDALEEALEGHPALVTIQAVNSETGLVLEVERVAEAAAERGIPVHVDAVQAAGRIPLPRADARPMLLTLSGHKMGGPRSTAILAVPESVRVHPLITGGGQERGLRAGTEDVVGAVGFARALELALGEQPVEAPRLAELSTSLERRIRRAVPNIRVFGSEGSRAPHIVQFGIRGIGADLLLGALDLDGVAASAGSACRSGSPGPGSALKALYGPEVDGLAPLRLSLGWNTDARTVEEAGTRVTEVIGRLIGLEPGTTERATSKETREP